MFVCVVGLQFLCSVCFCVYRLFLCLSFVLFGCVFSCFFCCYVFVPLRCWLFVYCVVIVLFMLLVIDVCVVCLSCSCLKSVCCFALLVFVQCRVFVICLSPPVVDTCLLELLCVLFVFCLLLFVVAYLCVVCSRVVFCLSCLVVAFVVVIVVMSLSPRCWFFSV